MKERKYVQANIIRFVFLLLSRSRGFFLLVCMQTTDSHSRKSVNIRRREIFAFSAFSVFVLSSALCLRLETVFVRDDIT